jgi:ribosomal protein S18 acetylase RimI-like enzyme
MLRIRTATDEDFSLLRDMYLEEVEDHIERAKVFADDLIHHFKTMLAFEGNQLCGTLTWDTRGGYDDGVVEMISLGVKTQFQRKGIARQLVNHFIEKASKFYSDNGYTLRVIILFMEGTNEVARKFYNSVGFREEARLSNLYPHDDGVIWTKHI